LGEGILDSSVVEDIFQRRRFPLRAPRLGVAWEGIHCGPLALDDLGTGRGIAFPGFFHPGSDFFLEGFLLGHDDTSFDTPMPSVRPQHGSGEKGKPKTNAPQPG
jgi:hypothetical protein